MSILLVEHQSQDEIGYCFPACVQMALSHLDIYFSQQRLASRLGVIRGIGVPASSIHRLSSKSIVTVYETEATLLEVESWIERSIPVIASVQTSELSYWKGQIAQHAVLIVGLDEDLVYVLDPAQEPDVIATSIDEFLLAWDEMGFTYSLLYKSE